MREPLDQFADRLVRCGEVEEFIRGLIKEKGVPFSRIGNVVSEFRYQIVGDGLMRPKVTMRPMSIFEG